MATNTTTQFNCCSIMLMICLFIYKNSTAMAVTVVTQHSCYTILNSAKFSTFRLNTSPQFQNHKYNFSNNRYGYSYSTVTCSSANKPTPSSEISSTARLRSEVLSPFRSVRMFFCLAFIASGSLGGLIATTRLIGALFNPARAAEVPEIRNGLGIDIGAVLIFAFFYYNDNKAKNVQLARLAREENLANLKLRISPKKVITVNELRGFARLVILSGSSSFISESFRLSESYTEGLLERGVLVVPFATDGSSPSFEFEESEEMQEITSKRKRLWQSTPVLTADWSKWLDEQKEMAKVSPESPVYLSLRLDGRVRASGVGYPPWNAFVAQLPPVKGMWAGLFDGFDGRV